MLLAGSGGKLPQEMFLDFNSLKFPFLGFRVGQISTRKVFLLFKVYLLWKTWPISLKRWKLVWIRACERPPAWLPSKLKVSFLLFYSFKHNPWPRPPPTKEMFFFTKHFSYWKRKNIDAKLGNSDSAAVYNSLRELEPKLLPLNLSKYSTKNVSDLIKKGKMRTSTKIYRRFLNENYFF